MCIMGLKDYCVPDSKKFAQEKKLEHMMLITLIIIQYLARRLVSHYFHDEYCLVKYIP